MRNLLGIHLQLLLGDVPLPAPLRVTEALQSVEVTLKDKEASGFQMVFAVGRNFVDLEDYGLMKESRLKPFTRALIQVWFGLRPRALIDGVITNQQLEPGDDPGQSKLTVTGKDLSVLLDLEQRAASYPALSEDQRVTFILARSLARYGVIPEVSSVENQQLLTPDRQVPAQDVKTTDLGYIRKLADRFGYVFHIEAREEVPTTNTAYWGPPVRQSVPQGALSVNLGPDTNVEKITFKYDEEAPKRIAYKVGTDSRIAEGYRGTPNLARRVPDARKLEFLEIADGIGEAAARDAIARGKASESFLGVTTANGTLDTLRYGRILRPRRLVDVRGAGEHFSGTYHVSEVTHKIDVAKGEWKQEFKLAREGVGYTSPIVATDGDGAAASANVSVSL